jgi:1,4-alpha-glucan branching enzyme
VRDLNEVYKSHGALHELDMQAEGFSWIQCDDWHNSVYAYIRYAKKRDDFVVVALNFTPVPRDGYRIGVPKAGYYTEILNSDADIYGGGNIGNMGGIYSEPIATHGHPQSISLRLPPLGMLILKPV